ncbi:DUF3759 domain-containing protein [Streptomyces sp. FXJ1.172]|uniref:DUF3759 domain-containing protein n=1 Tax=Streptomyces sp. FXJ1.172 TaxID=710705 RepID=UPI0007CF4535|nr:DUF3759 domain-containing protein [Streptomyces sp. FXJ1.172]WEO93112.1 DUF3759 domain-containing protein [Streptomyces sp. FXJ1.172]
MPQHSIRQYKDAHTVIYGGTVLDRNVTEEQAGHAAAWEATRKLKESGQPIDSQNLTNTLEALARQQADRLMTDLGLDYLDDKQVKRHAAAAAARIAPDFATA